MNVLTKVVCKTKVYRIRSQQMRESCGMQPTNEWVERRRRDWGKHVIRINAEKLFKISRNNTLRKKITGRPKRRFLLYLK